MGQKAIGENVGTAADRTDVRQILGCATISRVTDPFKQLPKLWSENSYTQLCTGFRGYRRGSGDSHDTHQSRKSREQEGCWLWLWVTPK
jgi:hypothetical protein